MLVPALTPPSPAGAPQYSWQFWKLGCNNTTSEPEEEEEQEPGAPADDQIELWDLNTIHNICNQNDTFAVPATYPSSFPSMTKKGGAGFVYKGYSFSCNDKKKAIH
ncbi:hypothetical protein DSO57_1010605 [Entomophthora muscae]|uniref:Uncharacterized protein n=1 Tax=Entomophthora muscae TaxID=34485 RepID=A0ACC2USH9_9FUNG|nr:hypothetical protein DSO57_1010605 [Entomophthora muscae]